MTSSIIKKVQSGVIGKHHLVKGPYDAKPIVYADSTASGKSLDFIEDYLLQNVHPFYANTHTEASATGRQTTIFREQARDMIRHALNAPKEDYVSIFIGSGCTAAIDRMVRVLQLSPTSEKRSSIQERERPVIFVGPYEHHSNDLPWRESLADVVVIPEDINGTIDASELEKQAIAYQNRPLKIASFSAASNVTGIRSDTRKITKLVHQYGFLSFWDFAAAAPHVRIDVQNHDMDAIFISTHKFVGGPGTPGLLVARKSIFTNKVPGVPAGGTVKFVQPNDHDYLEDIEHREEGGTPAIIESIRAGLVYQLYHLVGPENIEEIEGGMVKRAISSWKKNPNIEVLGNSNASRVSIVSFIVKAGGRVLHPNFVVALLNDIFGIQARGGCSCAAPYGHRLLNIGQDHSNKIKKAFLESGMEILKPGWTRVSFTYYFDPETVDYIINAVHMIANEGFKFLSWYKVDKNNGSFTHVNQETTMSLSLWDLSKSKPACIPQKLKNGKSLPVTMTEARKIFACAKQGPIDFIRFDPEMEEFRFFALSQDFPRKRDIQCKQIKRDVISLPKGKENYLLVQDKHINVSGWNNIVFHALWHHGLKHAVAVVLVIFSTRIMW